MARPAEPQRRGWLAGLAAALLFGCSAPLISTLTGSGSALSIVGLLHGGATLAIAGLTIAGAVVISGGSLSGAQAAGSALIALATLTWGIDNTISQRLSLRNPIPIATFKAAGASVPMLTLALGLGGGCPGLPATLGLLAIGARGAGSRSGSICWPCAISVPPARRCCSPPRPSSGPCSPWRFCGSPSHRPC